MSQQVKVNLIDFKSSTLEDHHHSEEINSLFQQLKLNINTAPSVPFSLNFDHVTDLKLLSGNCFDIAISYTYDKIIVCSGNCLSVYHRSESPTLDTNLDCTITVGDFHCLHLSDLKNDTEEFIYATTSTGVVKLRLSDVMNGICQPIWISSTSFTNSWGLHLYNGILIVIDFNGGMYALDPESGKIITPKTKLPNLSHGYGIIVTEENEMILSSAAGVQIYRTIDNEWKCNRTSKVDIQTGYSIFYEKSTQLIYLSNTEHKEIMIFKKEDLSLVHSLAGMLDRSFGIFIDFKTGLLFVCQINATKV